MATPAPDLSLDLRTGLPDSLRLLLEDFPRDEWQGHENFAGLIQFWMERHMMFRKLLEMLQTDAQQFLDRGTEFQSYAPKLSRFGSLFLNELNGHHHIEDTQYFPLLSGFEPTLATGFELLDKAHHAIHDHLEAFAAGANAVLQAQTETEGHDAAGAFLGQLGGIEAGLNRHLLDEEDLIAPIILKHGPNAILAGGHGGPSG